MMRKILTFAVGLMAVSAQAQNSVYEVPIPTTRPELAEVSTMKVFTKLRQKEIFVEQIDHDLLAGEKIKVFQLNYDLPTALVGERRGISLSVPVDKVGADGKLEMVSQTGDAAGVCLLQQDASYTCSVFYDSESLKIDPAKVEEYLAAVEPDPLKLKLKRDLSIFFANEARGIIRNVRMRK